MSTTTADPELAASRRSQERSARAKFVRALSFRNISAIYVLIGLIILYALWVPDSFLTTQTLKSLLAEQAIVAIVAIGLVLPLAAGVFDLSIGMSVGIGSILVAWFIGMEGIPIVPAILLTILGGVVIGGVNALLVTKVGIDSFIATLGISSCLTAAAVWITDNQPIVGLPNSFQSIATSTLFGIALPVYILIVIAIVLWYVLEYTPMGRYIYATGGNPEAARLSGVPTMKIVGGTLIAAATIAAFAGVLVSSRLSSATPDVGPSYLLPAFAAAFLGSTQLKNGQYNIWGTVIAVYVLATGVKGLLLAGAPLWLPDLFNGIVLLLAVGLSIRRHRAQARESEQRVADAAPTAPPASDDLEAQRELAGSGAETPQR
jgi:ribose transport system permease protein